MHNRTKGNSRWKVSLQWRTEQGPSVILQQHLVESPTCQVQREAKASDMYHKLFHVLPRNQRPTFLCLYVLGLALHRVDLRPFPEQE